MSSMHQECACVQNFTAVRHTQLDRHPSNKLHTHLDRHSCLYCLALLMVVVVSTTFTERDRKREREKEEEEEEEEEGLLTNNE